MRPRFGEMAFGVILFPRRAATTLDEMTTFCYSTFEQRSSSVRKRCAASALRREKQHRNRHLGPVGISLLDHHPLLATYLARSYRMRGSKAPVRPAIARESPAQDHGWDSSSPDDPPGSPRISSNGRRLSRSALLARKSVGALARRTLGLGLLLATVLLWTGSNFLASVSLQVMSCSYDDSVDSLSIGHICRRFFFEALFCHVSEYVLVRALPSHNIYQAAMGCWWIC